MECKEGIELSDILKESCKKMHIFKSGEMGVY